MSYMKESTNNFNKSVFHLIKYGCISVACIYCENTYKIQSKTLLYHRGETLFCYECGIDAMAPITEDSILYNMDETDRKEQIKKWHIEGFVDLIDDNEFYYDYEYDNCEEIKEEPTF
uniref:Uncharacterized protein n=1 Tax=viral metagenome TaxID=1070528 RepID=A0A6C0CJP0_9ZZZZ